MGLLDEQKEMIFKKIKDLPAESIQEVIDFIDFLKIKKQKERTTDMLFLLIQQENLKKIWDSEAEDLYEI